MLFVFGIVAFRLRESFPWLAGVVLGIAINFKVWPVVFLGFFVWDRRAKLVLSTVLTYLFVTFAFPALMEGPTLAAKLWRDQAIVLSHYQEVWAFDGNAFQTWPAFFMRLARLAGVDEPLGIYRVATLVGVALVGLAFLKSFLTAGARPAELSERLFVFVCGAIPLLIPLGWYNMMLGLTPACAYLMAQAAWWPLGIFFACFVATAPYPIGRVLLDRWHERLGVPFLGLLALLVAYLSATRRRFTSQFW
jgi:hypothetical protein